MATSAEAPPTPPTTESEVSRTTPTGEPSTTCYKIIGDLSSATSPPLIALHGGPGAGHEYLSPLTAFQGPSEFQLRGWIKDWEGWRPAHKIAVPTLLLNGRYDEVIDKAMEPWFYTIPRVRWVTLENSSHMGHWEDTERYIGLCGAFLASRDPS
ncbi:Uu.00g096300.m01.CDS01 [Anthostomella pinea]|uniref:Uu.00g096300.m01.CDS01 n=1 Tax=Anthostomella pinea TaxID=933095 RepID=A0AAI8VC98_9PEZI|nr:Uu.00g096300.m01.CDS01 [Anthostomella pinea]